MPCSQVCWCGWGPPALAPCNLADVDAGFGKLTSPDAAWSIGAEVGALDTYLRHTPIARLARWLLGPRVLRYAGAATAWLELTIAPLAFLMPSQAARRTCIGAAVALHLGIALTMRNTVALSAAGVTAWLPFIDGPAACSGAIARGDGPATATHETAHQGAAAAPTKRAIGARVLARGRELACSVVVGLLALGSAWHQAAEFGAPACASGAHDASDLLQATMLHNRWNVFTGAEPYVVWEVAPARLDDGSVVDLWRGTASVSWEVPRGAAPSSRGGRWRSWPYLAERTAEADTAFWGTLCDEWEARDPLGRHVVQFVFYLLQADVIPAGHGQHEEEAHRWIGYEPQYGSVRKRRIRQFSCSERR